MGLYKEAMKEKYKLDQIIKEIQNHQYLNYPGRLRCTKGNKHDQYYIDGSYVKSSDLNLAKGLAQRDYEKKLLPILKDFSEKLDEIQKSYETNQLENVYAEMCEGRRTLVIPYFTEKEKFVSQWSNQEYDHWEITDQTKGVIYTGKGERVRSKSEKIIADELARFQIPYRYEYPLELSTGKSRKVIRPDFVVLNRRNLKEYIIEHLGMMDNADYSNRTVEKLDLYEKNGYLIGRDLLLLHETADAPLDMTVLDKYIREFLI